ncbi:MAG: flavodoxin family protein [Promethearchaeota archaeon]
MKVLIVYDTKYGNTEKVAKLIAEGINSNNGNEVIVNNVKDVNLKKEASYDLILIGSPVHFGKHVGSVKKFINKLPKSQLKVNTYSIFNTYMGEDPETTEEGICYYKKMLDKMDKQINEMMSNLTKLSSPLSIKVAGMKGPILNEELPKCKDFGMKIVQGYKTL